MRPFVYQAEAHLTKLASLNVCDLDLYYILVTYHSQYLCQNAVAGVTHPSYVLTLKRTIVSINVKMLWRV